MRPTLFQRLRYFAFASDLNALRLTLALGAILIGIGFLWPAQLFPTPQQIASNEGRSTYSLMAQMAPQWLWGASFLAQGALMLWSLLYGVHNRCLLWVDAAFGSLLWTLAVGACYLAYWPGFSNIMSYRPPAIMGGELAAAFASWWVFVRYHCETDNGRSE